MYDNKYLYFNNLLYTYSIIGYDRIEIYDIQIMLITMIDILSHKFKLNLGKFIRYYMDDYTQTLPHIIDNDVPTLTNLCLNVVNTNNISTNILPKDIEKNCSYKLWTNKDKDLKMLDYFHFLHNRDKQTFMNHIFKKYNEYIENLPEKYDLISSNQYYNIYE